MPGGQERALRRRINSVQSTKQITRAMELIAATRVVKAMTRANAARPYSSKMTGVIEDLAAGGVGIDAPLLRAAALRPAPLCAWARLPEGPSPTTPAAAPRPAPPWGVPRDPLGTPWGPPGTQVPKFTILGSILEHI